MSLISLIDVDLAVTYSRALPVFMREWLMDRGYTLSTFRTRSTARSPATCCAGAAPLHDGQAGNPGHSEASRSQRGDRRRVPRASEISLKGTRRTNVPDAAAAARAVR